jgi:hypothetical protein
MSTKIFKNYQDFRELLSLEEVKKRIADLTTSLRGNESYYRRFQPKILTKKEREDIIFQSEIQDEIDFYEHQIQNEIDFYEEEINGFEDEEEDVEVEKVSALDRAALIKNYHNPSLFICILEAREFIENLESSIKNKKKHYGFCFNQQQIEDEIHYYKTAIFRARQTYKEDAQSLYGYSLRPRTPSVSDSDSEDEVEEPSAKMDELEKKIDNVENVVYQLLGGLFNQTTQSNIIDSHLCDLRGTRFLGAGINEESIWPTTRQGDQNEEEIRLLKQQVSKLEGTVEMLVRIIKDQNRDNNDTSISSSR